MKKILFLLLSTVAMYGQVPADATPLENIQITNNKTSTTATKVNVQENDGTINTISKLDLVNVVEADSAAGLPITGVAGKLYITKDNSKIYRWNGTYYTELAITDISGKVDKVTGKSLLSDTEITRLATLSNYTHPTNHPPSIITQDASNRFVTDVEKTAWNDKQGALGFTPENVANKSDSYTVSSTVTYPSTKALVDGLETKISGTLTTNRIPKSFGTKSIGNSSLNDNGSEVSTNLPIHANSFVKSISSTNLLLASGSDITQASLPISTATQTVLNLKANLASPTFTGTPTAPTAAAETNTTQIATTAFVTGAISTADSGNVKLTGNQGIAGEKTFTNNIVLNGGVLTFSGASSLQTGNPSIYRIGNRLALNVAPGGKNVILDGNEIASSITLNLQNSSGTFALTNNPTPLTATSFIKPSAPTTNILLAGGGDIAQNTAFNKPFGITAGTVVEGNDSRILNGQTAFSWGNHAGLYPTLTGNGATGTWGINISGTAANSTLWGGLGYDGSIQNEPIAYVLSRDGFTDIYKRTSDVSIKSWLGLGSNAYTSTPYLPLSGGTLSGAISGTSATFSSTVTASGGFFNSDRRLKNIFKRDGDVAYYTWKDGRDTKEHIGYVAQEVQEKHPNQVQADEKGMLSVNYVEILVEKIRMLEKRIEELEKSK